MKIKNNGKKIVHIGADTLMPGDEIIADARVADAPAIKILASHGILSIIDDDTITTPKPVTTPITPPITATPAANASDATGKRGGKKGGSDPTAK